MVFTSKQSISRQRTQAHVPKTYCYEFAMLFAQAQTAIGIESNNLPNHGRNFTRFRLHYLLLKCQQVLPLFDELVCAKLGANLKKSDENFIKDFNTFRGIA